MTKENKNYKEVQFVNRKNVIKGIQTLFYSKPVEEVGADYLQALIDIKQKVQKMNSYNIKVIKKQHDKRTNKQLGKRNGE